MEFYLQNEHGRIPISNQLITTIGSDRNCTIVVKGRKVSRKHSEITFSDGKTFINDLESMKGTFVNDQRVKMKCELRANDLVGFGVCPIPKPPAKDSKYVYTFHDNDVQIKEELFPDESELELERSIANIICRLEDESEFDDSAIINDPIIVTAKIQSPASTIISEILLEGIIAEYKSKSLLDDGFTKSSNNEIPKIEQLPEPEPEPEPVKLKSPEALKMKSSEAVKLKSSTRQARSQRVTEKATKNTEKEAKPTEKLAKPTEKLAKPTEKAAKPVTPKQSPTPSTSKRERSRRSAKIPTFYHEINLLRHKVDLPYSRKCSVKAVRLPSILSSMFCWISKDALAKILVTKPLKRKKFEKESSEEPAVKRIKFGECAKQAKKSTGYKTETSSKDKKESLKRRMSTESPPVEVEVKKPKSSKKPKKSEKPEPSSSDKNHEKSKSHKIIAEEDSRSLDFSDKVKKEYSLEASSCSAKASPKSAKNPIPVVSPRESSRRTSLGSVAMFKIICSLPKTPLKSILSPSIKRSASRSPYNVSFCQNVFIRRFEPDPNEHWNDDEPEM